MSIKKPAIFLDRDGIVNDVIDRGDDFFVLKKKVRYTAPYSYTEFKPKEGVLDFVKDLKKRGFLCILVTNQPDISYGLLSKEDHELIMSEVRKIPFDDIFVCPHGRKDMCNCKKPKPGMLEEAMDKWDIDIKSSFFLGDTISDVGAAKAVGCKSIIINTEYNQQVDSDYRVYSLFEVFGIIG